MMIKGMLAGDKIISNSADAFSTYERSRIGEKEGRRIEYNSVEALYLIDKAKMEVFSDKGEKIDVLPIAVQAEEIKNMPITFDLRKEFPDANFIIFMASRLTPEKNIRAS